jgi:hypothetical protein
LPCPGGITAIDVDPSYDPLTTPLLRRDRYLLAILFITGLVLKLLWTGRNPLAHDEPFTLYWAVRPFAEFLAMLGSENNPPLHFLIVRGWLAVTPMDPAWLRVPSALFSAAAVVPLYLLAHRSGGTRAAVVAGLLFTFNGHHYGFAHELRAYSLFTLLTIAALWQLVRLADGKPRAMFWLLLMNVLLVYTHFFGWLVVGVEALCVLFVDDIRAHWRRWSLIAMLTVLAYVPYAGIIIQRAGTSIAQGTWLSTPQLEEVYNMLWRWSNAPVLAVVILALILFTLVRDRVKGLALGLGTIWTFVPLLGLYLVSQAVPVYLDRYLLFASPGWFLLAGVSVSRSPGITGPIVAVFLTLGAALTFKPWERSAHRPEVVVERIEEWRTVEPCAPVLVVPAWYRLTYRFAQDHERFVTEPPSLLHSHELEPGSPDCPTLLLVNADPPDEAGQDVVRQVRSAYSAVDSVQASHKVRVVRYRKR